MANERSLPYRAGSTLRRAPGDYARYLRSQAEGVSELAQEGAQAGAGGARDFWGGLMGRSPETAAAVREAALGKTPGAPDFSSIAPGSAPQTGVTLKDQPSEAETALVATDPIRRLAETRPEVMRQALAEQARRTIRAVKDPKTGVTTYQNTSDAGDVVVRGGESVGPDRGAPGGALSMDTSDEARAQYEGNMSPEAQANIAEQRARQKLAETLTQNPFAREMILQQQQQQAAADRALMGRRWDAETLRAEADLESERDAAHQEIDADATLTPEQKAEAKAFADREIQLEGLRRGVKPRTNPLA